jgi:electron transfer flavoprotein beta subunit
MKIVVLVKQVPDTWNERRLDTATGLLDRVGSDSVMDEIDERALEAALSYRDAHEADVVVLTMGPSSAKDMLRKALALGADSAVHVLDDRLAGADVTWTAAVIAAALTRTGFDLVIAGDESTDGRGGVVPAMIAEHLGVAHATHLDSMVIDVHEVSGERSTENGSMTLHASLPAVVSVTEQSAEARFPTFKNIIRAKKKPVTVLSLADLGLDPVTSFAGTGRSSVLTAAARPARAGGTKIVDSGTAGTELAEFLAAARLI